MDSAIVQSKNLEKNDNNFESSKQDCLLSGESSSITKLQIRDFCTQKLLLQQISILKKTIPKQIMTLEEKYIRHCLESIHMSTIRQNNSGLISSRVVGDNGLLLFSSGIENVVISSSANPVVGSITGSTSMINLINSPLLRRLGNNNNNINYENTRVTEVSEKKKIVSRDQVSECDNMHKRIVSFSSTNSTSSSSPSTSSSSTSSSSSSSSVYSHGMLHCSWNNGFPRYVFSAEDQREVYTTNLLKTGSDYVYMFYSRSGKREINFGDDESNLVGKMTVSTSVTLCPLGTEIMETKFILCANDHQIEFDTHTSNQNVKKNIGISKKVANILRGSNSYRRRTYSKFDGSLTQQENFLQSNEEANLNLELAAIVVKDHIPYKKVEVGGWGLKFLKDEGVKRKTASVSCEACKHNSNHHSVSMDVVVPAGLHGGPNAGPSGIIDRWRSGGSCDCGGWDLGCPLTVLNNSGLINKDVFYQDGVFGKSNSFELFTQGCKRSVTAVIQVTNVHDGLYYIHYNKSTLSDLQSLSVAVAIIHSHSPTLKPKLYRN